jgi:hypothetical protein
MERGHVSVFRKILEWEWFDDAELFRFFLILLVAANHKSKKWKGATIERGQMVTSISHLATLSHRSEKQVRGRLKKLENSGEISIKRANKFSVITINNYIKYQDYRQTPNEEITEKGQASGQASGQAKGQAKGQQLNNGNNGNKDNNNNKLLLSSNKSITADFSNFQKELFDNQSVTDTTIDNQPIKEDSDLDFARVWELYGKKGNKKTSEQKWSKLKKQDKIAALKNIPAYIASKTERQYIKNFETYINQEVWNDEIITKQDVSTTDKTDEWLKKFKEKKNN